MEKEAIIGNVFGKTIYKTSIKNHQYLNNKAKPLIEKFVKEKPGSVAATTDVEGNTNFTNLDDAVDNLHLQEEYSELFDALAFDIKGFMAAKSYDDTKFDINITKAWATYTTKGQNIPSHKHTASHFSCVYYVHNEDMGNIKFEQELYWLDIKDVIDAPLAVCQEVGWMVTNNKNKIVVMRSYSKDKDEISGGGAIAIPKGWITKIEYLEVSYGERSDNR